MNISEFERSKPTGTYNAFTVVKNKYEDILKETVVMNAEDAVKVEMASVFLKDLQGIYKKFLSGE